MVSSTPGTTTRRSNLSTILNETRVRIDDATVDLVAGGDIVLKGIVPLDGFYSPRAALNLSANNSVTVNNNIQMSGVVAPNGGSYAVYPGTFTATSLTGDVNVKSQAGPPTFISRDANNQSLPIPESYNASAPAYIVMAPSPYGQLSLMAGSDILPSKIAMLDIDSNYVPGLFTLGGSIIYTFLNPDGRQNRPYQWDTIGFPLYKSTLSIPQLKRQHTSPPIHADDDQPVYIYAGGDIGNKDSGLSLSLPKQARVYAGRDIVNMIFQGQNLNESDITRWSRHATSSASLHWRARAPAASNPPCSETRSFWRSGRTSGRGGTQSRPIPQLRRYL